MTSRRGEQPVAARARRALFAALVLAGAVGAARGDTLYELYAPSGSAGPGPGDVGSLWRVWVVGGPAGARCADGTNPVLYVRAAPAGSAHPNDWVFYLPGGGSGTDADRLLDSWMHGEKNELSSRWADESISPGGILGVRPANPFRDWNVVKIDKCTMDRFQGTRMAALTTTVDAPRPGGGVVPAGTPYDAWFNGALIVADGIDLLRNGTVTYLDRDATLIEMPDLDNARRILWTGSSGGSRAALMTADWVAQELLPEDADVRLVADAWFYPGAELLADAQANGWTDGSFWDGSYGFDAQSGSNSDVYYDTGARAVADVWGSHQVIDQSCFDTHLADGWKCFDEIHVLMHHVETPAFISQDQKDGNHLTPCWQVDWREDPADCYLPNASPPADFERYATATQWQFADLALSAARREEPAAADPRGFGPRCDRHVGLTDDVPFLRHAIVDPVSGVEVTFAAALDAWLRGQGTTLWETSVPTQNLPASCQ